MTARIIKIDEEKCNGCGACAAACHEGAIEMIDGKARLTREDYCDGLGDCLPVCPCDAISFIPVSCESGRSADAGKAAGRVLQWPVQIKLVNPGAAGFEGANLLIAADCTAYAYAGFHEAFAGERVILIGCPKLDAVDYAEKLQQIFAENNIMSVTVVRMEVPCCGGLESAVKRALQNSGRRIPWNVVTISTAGKLLD